MSGWGWALLALTALRLLAAALVPLSPDEAYYWVWSRVPQAGYLDHPPMVALWVRAGTALLGETPLGIRLLGPLSVAAGSVLLAHAGRDLFPGRPEAGVWAAALLNATLLLGVGAVLITPDTPLIFFWVATLWVLARLHRSSLGGADSRSAPMALSGPKHCFGREARTRSGDGRWWLAVGAFAGCALLSKYTAVLLGVGIALWLILSKPARVWLWRWQVWASGALAALVSAPVVAWNAAHGWASFVKQGGRAGAAGGGGGDALRWLGELVGGQIGLATPIVFALCVAGAGAALLAWWRRGDSAAALLAALVLPGAALFLWQATGSRVQGNWPAILYPAAALAAAGLLGGWWRRWRGPALALGAALTAVVYVQAMAAPVPLPRRNDPTLARLGGWEEFAAGVEAARRAAGAAFVAAEEYGLAAELAFRLPAGVPVVAMDPARWRLFDLPAPEPASGVTGLLVRSERRGEGPPLWPDAAPAGGLTRARRGVEAERYRLYHVQVAPGQPAAVRLPRPERGGPAGR